MVAAKAFHTMFVICNRFLVVKSRQQIGPSKRMNFIGFCFTLAGINRILIGCNGRRMINCFYVHYIYVIIILWILKKCSDSTHTHQAKFNRKTFNTICSFEGLLLWIPQKENYKTDIRKNRNNTLIVLAPFPFKLKQQQLMKVSRTSAR